MAISSRSFWFAIFFQLFLSRILYANECKYTSIISFGDSLADTGTLINLNAAHHAQPPHCAFLPYGKTFFHKPTGRCSNGRLIIDFIAQGFGLPFIPPYVGEGHKQELRQGVNYAVAGATALSASFHEARGVINPSTNASLQDQIEWFKKSLPSFGVTNSSGWKNLFQHSLFLMGEIGGNDYNHELRAGKSINEVRSFVPLVIKTIIAAVQEVIKHGAKTIVVPGNFPIGCSSSYLTMYSSSDEKMYDNTTGCIIRWNKFAEYHNQLLQRELHKLRKRNHHVNIVYADYYNAAMQFYRSPKKFGFLHGALKACCGAGGQYNYNQSVRCGDPASTTLITHPNTYASWDGVHLTEAAYRLIYKFISRFIHHSAIQFLVPKHYNLNPQLHF